MEFTRNDLFYTYSWAADGGDNPHYKKYLDRIKVDKTEGYEVLYFCNDFLRDHDKSMTKSDFQRVERILKSEELRNIVYRTDLNYEVNRRWHNFLL
ncbi:hypothetical protein PQ462_12635 [Flavobacterium sp. KACC 22758]|uniref:hypothetical protein n=1 Tax=Flavobacterium sp. KACC 22758 TaxID=3025667 RepID=UPI002366B22E|nr:hypothetical protein [Flavobacterium sp. KACC 22758]WDF57563.1 hypothetical protein PQ462_12635 [Flavobacterium sp. KACC 22758]